MKNIELNEVYTLKLSSGEEVISKVIAVDADTITLSEPLSVAPGPQGIGLMPSMFTAEKDKSVTLNTRAITMYCETADPIRIKYIEATTGITTASKRIVLG
jgi:hypothetical protein